MEHGGTGQQQPGPMPARTFDPDDRFVPPHLITRRYGVTVGTLRRWAEDGKLECRRCPGGKRLYRMASVAQLFGEPARQAEEGGPARTGDAGPRHVCYARVSSAKQRADLDRQIADLQAAYPDAEVLSDIGSGLNWKRPHFLAILDHAHEGLVGEVVVAHKDRLCRFAFELVEWIFKKCGVRVVVLGDFEAGRDELADDLLSVVNVFVARHNGRRGAAGRKRRLAEAKATEEAKARKRKERKGGGPSRWKRRKQPDTDENEEGEDLSDSGSEEDDRPLDRCRAMDLQPVRGGRECRDEADDEEPEGPMRQRWEEEGGGASDDASSGSDA